MMLPTKFQFIWESSFREEDFFRNQPITTKVVRLNPSHEWRGVLDTILYYVIKFVCELWQVTTKPVHLYDLFQFSRHLIRTMIHI